MAYTAAKEILSEADMNRLACCFLNSENVAAVDWEAAAAQYDPKVKPASFRTVTGRVIKKVQTAAGINPSTINGEKSKQATATGTKKRKATTNADDEGSGDDEASKPTAKKAKGGARGKKAAAATTGDDADGSDDYETAKKKDKGGKRGKKAAAVAKGDEEEGGTDEADVKAEANDEEA